MGEKVYTNVYAVEVSAVHKKMGYARYAVYSICRALCFAESVVLDLIKLLI